MTEQKMIDEMLNEHTIRIDEDGTILSDDIVYVNDVIAIVKKALQRQRRGCAEAACGFIDENGMKNDCPFGLHDKVINAPPSEEE